MVQNLEKSNTDKKSSQASTAKDSKQSAQTTQPSVNKPIKNSGPRMDPSGLPKLR